MAIAKILKTATIGSEKSDVLSDKVVAVAIRLDTKFQHLVTIIENLPEMLYRRVILEALKKKIACGGNLTSGNEHGKFIELQGDYCTEVKDYLVDVMGLNKKIVHMSTPSSNIQEDRR